jgi:hypothetical protein
MTIFIVRDVPRLNIKPGHLSIARSLQLKGVMARFSRAIHEFFALLRKTWMPGPSPGMTVW